MQKKMMILLLVVSLFQYGIAYSEEYQKGRDFVRGGIDEFTDQFANNDQTSKIAAQIVNDAMQGVNIALAQQAQSDDLGKNAANAK